MKSATADPARTLARLSFWVPAARLSEFETAYHTRLAPILKEHGLVESSERGRPTAAGVFSRLFAVEGPGEVAAKREALEADPAFKAVLQELGKSFQDGLAGNHVTSTFQDQKGYLWFPTFGSGIAGMMARSLSPSPPRMA